MLLKLPLKENKFSNEISCLETQNRKKIKSWAALMEGLGRRIGIPQWSDCPSFPPTIGKP